jgi:hypothetical protein
MLPAPILGYERWRVGSRTIAQTPDNGNTATDTTAGTSTGTSTGTSAADTTAIRRRTRQSNQGQFDRAAWHRLITDRVAAERLAAVKSWIAGEWTRAGDWVAISTDGTITADLQLTTRMPQPSALQLSLTPAGQARPGGPAANSTGPAGERPRRPVRFINLTSASLPGIPDGALRLSAGGLDLAAMLDLFPTAPRIGGTLSSDLTFGFHPDGAGDYIIAARGDLTAKDFAYEGRRIADIGADINFGSGNAGSHEGKSPAHGVLQLDAAVSLESRQAVTARGTWAADGMDFTVDIPAVPLSIAQNLIPPGSATLHGAFDGRLRITGQPDKPVVTGDVGFTDARADIALIGTSFGISPDRVRIADNRVTFTDWGLTAPNNRKMAVNGAINIANPAAPRADLTIRARDFQFVNSRHVGGSQIYGNGSLDANITARGPLDAMTVRGDVDLAGTSDIVYIMRDEAKSVRDEKQHIVQFVSFADSLYADDETILPPIRRAGVDVLIGVGIGSGLKATLSLDELNENRMHLVGGGDLTYSMNSQGDTRLAGRYTLTGGTLYYKPPVIPQKVFAVTDGSYVEWAGAVDQPRLKIAATQNLKVRLDQENGASQDVDFLVSIDIAGSLAGMDMSFDLAAPSNLAIQNQLMVMRPEEKQQQALTLLIYNRYTGLGGTTSTKGMMEFDARGQLGNFISKEINQWARNNLRGVDFSMGIDTRSDMVGDTRTDYSYNVSKSIFSDRVKISIGGKVSDEATSENFANSLLEDVSLEYRLTERDNMYLKLYRYNTRESILEGEVTETGAGFMIRKKVDRLGDIFRRQRPPRRYLRQLRESEKTTNER